MIRSKGMHLFWLPLLACLLWLCFTFVLYRHAVDLDMEHRLELEHMRLSTVARQLMDARNWNAAHGGVYVLESPYGKPNPWLPEHERIMHAADGRTLVLMNPAYMSRQLAESSSWPGIRIAIISKQPLGELNYSNAWESRALDTCMQGPREVFIPPHESGENSLRLLAVLTAQPSCLRCHVQSRAGDVLGGVSVSQEATDFITGVALHQGQLRMVYGLLAFTGVLAIGGLTLNLNRRRWQAEETSRMKSAFMARLSHDMRTPLTSIAAMSELLHTGETDFQERTNALHYINNASRTLLEMVSDITDHASLEQGVLTLHERDFSLSACIRQSLEIYQPVARAKSLDLEKRMEGATVDVLYGDDFRLRQALGNLVSNAVKFTETGSVVVSVFTLPHSPQDQDTILVRLLVEDSGPGLHKDETSRIFESFERGSQAHGQPGTGLGLSIVRTIARRMGGEVNVSTRAGGGSCFTLTVFMKRGMSSTEKRSLSATDASDHGILQGLHILVADDNPAGRHFLEKVLRKEGATLEIAKDGDEVLALLDRSIENTEWDMLLLDVNMPRRSGLEVLERIRMGRTMISRDTCVVFYTAALDQESKEICQKFKPDAVLIKPLSAGDLCDRLRDLSTGKYMPEIVASEDDLNMERGRFLAVWDKAGALAAMDNDQDIFRHLLQVLQQDLQRMADELSEILNSGLDHKKHMDIRRLAHACKNSAGTMCLLQLQAYAAEVEKASESELGQQAEHLLHAIHTAILYLAEKEENSNTPEKEQS